ncbi:MAG: endonuclease domain-containing protein [Chitinophagaceae bacterium]|nr:endonuclease domain-containing protein [Chitinophagaceae bacterium]
MTSKSPYKKGGMFEGATHLIFEKAKVLRRNMTPSEQTLWMYLKEGINKLKFRRQHPIGLYIADFYCHKVKLIIEIDGSIHEEPEVKQKDELRQKELKSWGYYIMRFSNLEVLQHIEKVMISIQEKISDLIKLQTQNASSKQGV